MATPIVRKPRIDFSGEIDRFYLAGNPIHTHLFNALNLLFPDGERFFVRAVHDHVTSIDDPVLLRDIRAFAGQEGQHAYQHERFFAVLSRQGYRVDGVLRRFRWLAGWSVCLPRALRLAITAGAEHYTATLARSLLDSSWLDGCHPEVGTLIAWHAFEEIEHKHVAYDVLTTCYPRTSYPLRVLGFGTTSIVIAAFTLGGLCTLLAQDRACGRLPPWRDARSSSRKAQRSQATLLRSAASYLMPGFHPVQHDDRALLARFKLELEPPGA